MTTPAHFDIAFDVMIGCCAVLFVTALVWLWKRRKSSQGQAIASQGSNGTPWKTKEHWRLKYEAEASEVPRLQQTHAEELRKLEDEARRQCEEEKRSLQAQVETKVAGPSKLVIHDATYGAIEEGGVDYPVTDVLNQIAGPNGLSFEIRNSQFKVNGMDYVPEDPRDDYKKRLKLTYSYDGGPSRKIRRLEKDGWYCRKTRTSKASLCFALT